MQHLIWRDGIELIFFLLACLGCMKSLIYARHNGFKNQFWNRILIFIPFVTRYFFSFTIIVQVILFEIDCAIFYTNLHELFCPFISWTNWINSGKFMDNWWISCQVMADIKKVYDDLIIINLYHECFKKSC